MLLLDAIQARLEAVSARVDGGIPFGEVVDAGPDVDIILRRV